MGDDPPDSFSEACGLAGPLKVRLENPAREVASELEFRCPFLVVGRGDSMDLAIDSPAVSRRHAYFQVVAGRVFCVDLGSRTGVRWEDGARTVGWVDRGQGVDIGPERNNFEGDRAGSEGDGARRGETATCRSPGHSNGLRSPTPGWSSWARSPTGGRGRSAGRWSSWAARRLAGSGCSALRSPGSTPRSSGRRPGSGWSTCWGGRSCGSGGRRRDPPGSRTATRSGWATTGSASGSGRPPGLRGARSWPGGRGGREGGRLGRVSVPRRAIARRSRMGPEAEVSTT